MPTPSKTSTLIKQNRAMREVLKEYMRLMPVYRDRPLGAPDSAVRVNQNELISLEDRARQLAGKP